MRELKFRAWDAEAQEMVAWEIIILDGFHKYLDGPLMQYIGINDSTGKEVYEGDIISSLQDGHRDVWAVSYNHEMMAWGCYAKSEPFMDFLSTAKDEDEEWLIIGNIYENPELLEGT